MLAYCAYLIGILGLVSIALIRKKSEVFFTKRKFSRTRQFTGITESFLNNSNNVTTVNQTEF